VKRQKSYKLFVQKDSMRKKRVHSKPEEEKKKKNIRKAGEGTGQKKNKGLGWRGVAVVRKELHLGGGGKRGTLLKEQHRGGLANQVTRDSTFSSTRGGGGGGQRVLAQPF